MVAFGTLSFALMVSPAVHAQATTGAQVDIQSAQPTALSTKAVSVSEGMAPATAPAPSLASAPMVTTTTSGSAPAMNNSTTVTVTATANAQNEVAQDSALAANSALRTENLKNARLQRESDNESRLIEKLEQGRLEDESRRAADIEKFKAGTGEAAQMAPAPMAPALLAPVAPVEAAPVAAPAEVAPIQEAAVPAATTVIVTQIEKEESDASFAVSPFVGYRWTSGNYALKVQNRFVGGLALEGAITKWLSLEGNFNFAQDEFRNKGNQQMVPSAYGPSSYPSSYGYYIRTRNTFGVMVGAKSGYELGRFKPFVAAAVGGRFSKYNIDDAYTKAVAQAAGWSRSTNNMLASAGLGVDYKVMRNFAIGTRVDYEMVLNKKNNAMNQIYGDSANGYRAALTAALVF